MALEATARQIAIQPMSQALQEYPEMAALFARRIAEAWAENSPNRGGRTH